MRPSLLYLVEGKIKQYVSWQPEATEFPLRKKKKYINTFEFLTKRYIRYGLRTKNIVKFVVLKYDKFEQILEE